MSNMVESSDLSSQANEPDIDNAISLAPTTMDTSVSMVVGAREVVLSGLLAWDDKSDDSAMLDMGEMKEKEFAGVRN